MNLARLAESYRREMTGTDVHGSYITHLDNGDHFPL